jgi:hypothetical protein
MASATIIWCSANSGFASNVPSYSRISPAITRVGLMPKNSRNGLWLVGPQKPPAISSELMKIGP